jgi:hypothetical protein
MKQQIGRRLTLLEGRLGPGGCRRCQGTLVVIRDAITQERVSARWNRKDLPQEEAAEREGWEKCPQCGRHLGGDPQVTIGGRGA